MIFIDFSRLSGIRTLSQRCPFFETGLHSNIPAINGSKNSSITPRVQRSFCGTTLFPIMDAHQQWWQQYYGSTTPSAGYGPLTHAIRHHYHHPYHQPHANTTTDNSTASPAPPAAFPPEPLPPPPASHHPTPPQLGVVPPNIPTLPDTWTPSDTHLDTNTVHGQTLFRTIQPTQWSRKYNLAGQPVLDIFPWQLSRFGLQDHSLRTLSQGRYTGIVTTRSIAEAVFTSQLLPEMRAHNLDIDSIAEYLHQQADQSIPNKTTEAKQFMQPLISRIIDFLRGLTPPAGEGTALRKLQLQTDRLQQQESELQRARDKLKTHGIALTPTKPGTHPPPSSASQPNHISHLQPQPHSQPPPFSTPLLKRYMTTHQPITQQQASRSGSRPYHQPPKHKSTTSSKFFVTNASQKNSSKRPPPATASRSPGCLSSHHVHNSSWWPRVQP